MPLRCRAFSLEDDPPLGRKRDDTHVDVDAEWLLAPAYSTSHARTVVRIKASEFMVSLHTGSPFPPPTYVVVREFIS
jgi:hypothetical protein